MTWNLSTGLVNAFHGMEDQDGFHWEERYDKLILSYLSYLKLGNQFGTAFI